MNVKVLSLFSNRTIEHTDLYKRSSKNDISLYRTKNKTINKKRERKRTSERGGEREVIYKGSEIRAGMPILTIGIRLSCCDLIRLR